MLYNSSATISEQEKRMYPSINLKEIFKNRLIDKFALDLKEHKEKFIEEDGDRIILKMIVLNKEAFNRIIELIMRSKH